MICFTYYCLKTLQAPKPYKFGYAVRDDKSQNDYSHHQESDGHVTTGSYRVALPDGRVQIVNYRADKNGYVADVQYEGSAYYPEYKPSFKTTYSNPIAAHGSTKISQNSKTDFLPEFSPSNGVASFEQQPQPPLLKSTFISQLEEPSFIRQEPSVFVQGPSSSSFREIVPESRERQSVPSSQSQAVVDLVSGFDSDASGTNQDPRSTIGSETILPGSSDPITIQPSKVLEFNTAASVASNKPISDFKPTPAVTVIQAKTVVSKSPPPA